MTPVERTEPAALTVYFLLGPQSQAAEPRGVDRDDSPVLRAGLGHSSAPLSLQPTAGGWGAGWLQPQQVRSDP